MAVVRELAVRGQQLTPEPFPAALQPAEPGLSLAAGLQWLQEQRGALLQTVARSGALLLRGFPLENAGDFDRFIRAFDIPGFTYAESLSNAVRVNVTERVFTANEAPPEVAIYLHHEMAQTPLFPTRLFFYCELAASAGGETPICRSDLLLAELDKAEPDFVRACAERGVRYTHIMPADNDQHSGQGRSWRSTLGVADRAGAEARLDALGYRFEWLDGEVLRATTPVLPAIRRLQDGRQVFFNQLIAAFRGWKDQRNSPRRSICFGDDSAIDSDAMATAIALADKLSFDLAWQSGDVALVDNFLVMHGRRPFRGQRRVLVSLGADEGDRLATES